MHKNYICIKKNEKNWFNRNKSHLSIFVGEKSIRTMQISAFKTFKLLYYSRLFKWNILESFINIISSYFCLENANRTFYRWYTCKMVIIIARGKELTNSQKDPIVKLWNEGKSYRRISDNLYISFTTISSFISSYKKCQTVVNQRRICAPRKISSRFSMKLTRQIKQNPMVTRQELQDDLLL